MATNSPEVTILDRVVSTLKRSNIAQSYYTAGGVFEEGEEYCEFYSIYVAPIDPIYEINRLNNYLHLIQVEVAKEGSYEEGFYTPNRGIKLGELSYTEISGTNTHIVKTTSPHADSLKGLGLSTRKGLHEKTSEDILRFLKIKIYPDSIFADNALSHHRALAMVHNDSYTSGDDLVNGYIHRWQIEQAQRGDDPFKRSPHPFVQKLVSHLPF